MPEDHFGEQVANRYDESAADMFDPAVVDPVVDLLADLAVDGIDLSEAMVARLRAKPGAERIGVTIGDFATTTVDGRFSVAYLVFNTIMNLTTQAAQVACFRNVAAHLEPGGCFVIEERVPDPPRHLPGEAHLPMYVS